MQETRGFSDKIIRIYLLGASVLLAFYLYAFHTGVMLTENTVIERRIEIAAPFHFNRFESGQSGVIRIDPLLTLYENHALLPTYIQSHVLPNWTGSMHLLLDDGREFQVVARQITMNSLSKKVYAVEASNSVEWDDTKLVLIEISLGAVGILLFLVTMGYMIRAAKRIASPFREIAKQLVKDNDNQFNPIHTEGEQTRELSIILMAVNSYRSRLATQIERERSFTRYVSHELRTPMMVIKGTVSNLRQQSQGNNKACDKLIKAIDQMQDLTHTFLLLARDGDLDPRETRIDEHFIQQLYADLEQIIRSNQIDFHWQLREPFNLTSHPQLTKAVITNLLKNAFACSVNEKVTLLASDQKLDVIDNGIGLKAQSRGYEGFGIGLVLVKDICEKYGWAFSLADNEVHGCTATIDFKQFK